MENKVGNLNETMDTVIQDDLNEMLNATNEIKKLGAALYNAPKGDEDKNIFRMFIDKLKLAHKEKGERVEQELLASEPNLDNKKDIVQKLIISSYLITKAYEAKARDDSVNIMPVLTLIPYYMDPDNWLSCMIEKTIPLLVVNDIV